MKNEILYIIFHSLKEYISLFDCPITECPVIPADTYIYYEPNSKGPKFLIRLTLNNSETGVAKIEYEPPLKEVIEAVLEGVDYILNTVDAIPSMESLLYDPANEHLLKLVSLQGEIVEKGGKGDPLWDSTLKGIDTGDSNSRITPIKLVGSLVENTPAKLTAHCEECIKVVAQYAANYDCYKVMYSFERNKEIEDFFVEEHTFEEYTKVI